MRRCARGTAIPGDPGPAGRWLGQPDHGPPARRPSHNGEPSSRARRRSWQTEGGGGGDRGDSRTPPGCADLRQEAPERSVGCRELAGHACAVALRACPGSGTCGRECHGPAAASGHGASRSRPLPPAGHDRWGDAREAAAGGRHAGPRRSHLRWGGNHRSRAYRVARRAGSEEVRRDGAPAAVKRNSRRRLPPHSRRGQAGGVGARSWPLRLRRYGRKRSRRRAHPPCRSRSSMWSASPAPHGRWPRNSTRSGPPSRWIAVSWVLL